MRSIIIVALKNISKIYPNGFLALKNIDLRVERGDIYGVIGYSGAGKSTLIRIINLLESPSNGEVIIDGVNFNSLNYKDLRIARQKIGMIFQHFNLLSSKNVFENVAFALEIARWSKSKIKNRVNKLLNLVGLEDKANYYPSQLSGGQKQRVAIARALANYPKILLCDEATSALDVKTTRSILNLIKDIQQKLDFTIILITHQIEVVKEICNKMCVINSGEIIENGFVKDIFTNPKASLTKELLSFIPSADINNSIDNKTYKIFFMNDSISTPLLSYMIRRFNIEVSILGGNIEEINADKIGYLLVKFMDNQDTVNIALQWLKNKGVIVKKVLIGEKND